MASFQKKKSLDSFKKTGKMEPVNVKVFLKSCLF